MVVALQLASLVAFIVAGVIGIRRTLGTDFVDGTIRDVLSVIFPPLALYLIGAVVLLFDMALLARAGTLPNQLVRFAGIFVVLLISSGLFLAVLLQTAKSQSVSALAGKLINLFRRSGNESVSGAGEKAAEVLDTRADPDQSPTAGRSADVSAPTPSKSSTVDEVTVEEPTQQITEPRNAAEASTAQTSSSDHSTPREIGSWWLSSHEALPNERVKWGKFTNRTQASGRSVGGKLFVTNKRILFCPHQIDAAMGGEKFAVPVEAIEDVGIEAPGTKGFKDRLFGGGARSRLRIELSDGRTELFVMNGVSNTARKLKADIGAN